MIHGVFGSGATLNGIVVTNANDGGNYNSGNSVSGRNVKINYRNKNNNDDDAKRKGGIGSCM